MNDLHTQFFEISVKVDQIGKRGGGEGGEEEGGTVEGEACYSITCDAQFNAKCQMIS